MKFLQGVAYGACGLAMGCGLIAGGGGGGIDTTFGEQGFAVVAVSGAEDKINAMAVGSDGGIFVAGSSRQATQDFAIAKLTADGSVDTAFGTGGHTLVDFGSDDTATSLALLPDGKLLVVGRSVVGSNAKLAVARLDSAGALDPTFGTAGKFDSVVGVGAEFRALAMDGLGRAVIAGSALISGTRRFVVLRLTPNGALDNTFADSGVSTLSPGVAGDSATALALGGGRIYVGGSRTATGSNNTDFSVLALTDAGGIDVSFGMSGVFVFDFTTLEPIAPGVVVALDTLNAMALESTGTLVLGGESIGSSGARLAAVRVLPQGIVDTSFGFSGAFLGQFKDGTQSLGGRVNSVQVSAGYLLAGTTEKTSGTNIAITTLSSDGQVATSDLISTGSQTEANASARVSGLKWLVGGGVFNGTDWDFLVVRLNR